MPKVIAKWQTRGGQRFVELAKHEDGLFFFSSDDGGGWVPSSTDQEAIEYCTRPWSHNGAGPAFLLGLDFPSTKRVI